ncbi:MAG: hypothetical protein J6M44_09015 [Butyrivibrio sp.]|nr:hypothetical protein [Butyrivibrio sp.]
MKKKILTLVLSMAMTGTILSGCGKETPEESSVFENIDAADKAETSESDQSATTKTQPSDNTSDVANETPASTGGLYEDFKTGAAKAKFTKSGDRGAYLVLSDILEDGQSYSLSEIDDKLASSGDYSFKVNGDATYRTIDCGNDGEKELLYQQEFTAEDMGGEIFTLFMILKDMGGELKICYDQDMWSRSDVTINDDGTIYGSGSGGAALHVYDFAFVDAKGDYHFYYGSEENITPFGDFYYNVNGESKSLSLEGLDTDHLIINTYYFEPDYEKRNDYISYNMIDDNYNLVTKDEDYTDANEVYKRLTENGIKVYKNLELANLLHDRAVEIGYPDTSDGEN